MFDTRSFPVVMLIYYILDSFLEIRMDWSQQNVQSVIPFNSQLTRQELPLNKHLTSL